MVGPRFRSTACRFASTWVRNVLLRVHYPGVRKTEARISPAVRISNDPRGLKLMKQRPQRRLEHHSLRRHPGDFNGLDTGFCEDSLPAECGFGHQATAAACELSQAGLEEPTSPRDGGFIQRTPPFAPNSDRLLAKDGRVAGATASAPPETSGRKSEQNSEAKQTANNSCYRQPRARSDRKQVRGISSSVAGGRTIARPSDECATVSSESKYRRCPRQLDAYLTPVTFLSQHPFFRKRHLHMF